MTAAHARHRGAGRANRLARSLLCYTTQPPALAGGENRRQVMSRYERESSGTGFAVGALTGAMVGAGLALLFAPKAGAELREDLSESVTSLRGAVTRRYQELAARAGVEIENLEERVDAAAESIEVSARELLTRSPRSRA